AGRPAEALEVLRRAHRAAPTDREILLGLATISRDSGAAAEALRYARTLAELTPGDPAARQLVAELQRATR
ncbi:MAG: tetratricopeptide repeat protein, partial [Thermoanaerobaculia bacterium]